MRADSPLRRREALFSFADERHAMIISAWPARRALPAADLRPSRLLLDNSYADKRDRAESSQLTRLIAWRRHTGAQAYSRPRSPFFQQAGRPPTEAPSAPIRHDGITPSRPDLPDDASISRP